jgi:predicted component of type VI protein secretion system
MPYVIIYHKDQEIQRTTLEGPATVGRSPDCELSVHDILLSRRHCRIEPEGQGWIVADLGSKNGTRVEGDAVVRTPLKDGDVIRMGKTAVRYRTGPLVPAIKPKTTGFRRPTDPFEALAGTVRDFSFHPVRVTTNGIPFPTPRPSPKEPDAYEDDGVRTLVSELVSSSWDSIYESASRPDAMVSHSHAAAQRAIRPVRPRQPRVDISLQAQPESEGVLPLPLPLPQPQDKFLPTVLVVKTAQLPATSRTRGVGGVARRLAPLIQWLVVLPLICLK